MSILDKDVLCKSMRQLGYPIHCFPGDRLEDAAGHRFQVPIIDEDLEGIFVIRE